MRQKKVLSLRHAEVRGDVLDIVTEDGGMEQMAWFSKGPFADPVPIVMRPSSVPAMQLLPHGPGLATPDQKPLTRRERHAMRARNRVRSKEDR